MGMGDQRHAQGVLPLGKSRYPLYRRMGGPQDRSGPVRKTSPPPGFDPGNVQPVASRYTDWTMTALRKSVHPWFKIQFVPRSKHSPRG